MLSQGHVWVTKQRVMASRQLVSWANINIEVSHWQIRRFASEGSHCGWTRYFNTTQGLQSFGSRRKEILQPGIYEEKVWSTWKEFNWVCVLFPADEADVLSHLPPNSFRRWPFPAKTSTCNHTSCTRGRRLKHRVLIRKGIWEKKGKECRQRYYGKEINHKQGVHQSQRTPEWPYQRQYMNVNKLRQKERMGYKHVATEKAERPLNLKIYRQKEESAWLPLHPTSSHLWIHMG